MSQGSGYRERNSTADRALHVLQMFTDERPEITAIEVAESLRVARSTAYRYLQTLVQSSFLTDTGRGGFRLGLRVLDLARIARKGFGLAEVSVPVMRELAEQFHQTVLLTRLMGNAVVCLEREEGRDQYVRLSYERGSVLAINAGAPAWALLAWLPESEARRLLAGTSLQRFTPNTLVDVDRIIERLQKIRETGHAVSVGEVDSHAMGVAAPILRRDGTVVAALSVVVVRALVSEAEVQAIVRELTDTAAKLGERVALLEI